MVGVEGQEAKTETEAVHTCEDILNAIGEYHAPYRNTTQERYAFFTTIQGTRDVDVFVRELKEKAAECNFCPLAEEIFPLRRYSWRLRALPAFVLPTCLNGNARDDASI